MRLFFQTLIIVVFYFNYALTQSPSGIVSIPIIYLPGDTIRGTSVPLKNNEFGFEIWLVNTDTFSYAYNAAQYGIDINPEIIGNGTLSAELISSQLSISNKQPKFPEFLESPNRIRLRANKFGNGGPFIQPGDSINIAVIKVSNSEDFIDIDCSKFSNLILRERNPDAVAVFIYADENMKANTGKAVMLNITRKTYGICRSE